jgi:hypothetical protein
MQKIVAAFALTLGIALAGAAQAQVDAGKVEPARKAAAQFTSMAAGSHSTGKPPRESDPAVRQLLGAVYDARDIDAAKNVPFTAVQGLSQRMQIGTQVAIIYMLAGTNVTDLSKAAEDPSLGDKINVNTVEFAPEFGRYFDFQLKVQGAIIDAVLVRIATSKPDDLKRMESGIADVRSGSHRAVAGIIETMALNGLTDEWLRARVPALSAIAPKLTKFLQPDQKAQLRELTLQVAAVTDEPQVKKALEDFAGKVAG